MWTLPTRPSQKALTLKPAVPPTPRPSTPTNTMPVKCNESLKEKYRRWFTVRGRNCEGDVWAQRYGMAHLFHSLKASSPARSSSPVSPP